MPTPSSSPRPTKGAFSFLSGVLLVLLIAVAPLAYGCTRPEPLYWLTVGLHLTAAVWVVGLLSERRTPAIPRSALLAATTLLTYAWLRLWLVSPETITAFTAEHFARICQRWPESVILRTPPAITYFTSGLLASFLVATDLSRELVWRKAFTYGMVAAACAVVVLGLVQNGTHAVGIYWIPPRNHMPSPFFGPFYHFTSAGAFINLTWPLAASMAMDSFKDYKTGARSPVAALTWTAVSGLLLLGHAGHVSRFPQVIAVVVLILLFALHRPLAGVRMTKRFLGFSALAGVLMTAVAVLAIERTGRVHDIAARWQMVNIWATGEVPPPLPPRDQWRGLMRDDLIVPYEHNHVFLRDRGAAYAFAVSAALQRPLLGFGPGGWIAAVSQSCTDPVVGTFYLYLQFTHEDFLQTLIEWGLVGSILWLTLLLGGIYRGARHSLSPGPQRLEDRSTSALIVGALAAVFAVLVQASIDFPLQIPVNAFYCCILLAFCWSSASRESRSAFSTKHVHE